MKHFFVYTLVISLFVGLISCERDSIIKQGNVTLNFSVDTVLFDTVFCSIGSVTKRFTVKNPYDETVLVKEIYLAQNNNYYRINIDGQPTKRVTNVEIPPKDSLYIFVEVTVDPQNENNPVLINDSIVFVTNDSRQDVDLVAYGQDVEVLRRGALQINRLTADKPYLVYDTVWVDSGNELVVDAGARLFFTNRSALIVFGKITVNGTLNNEVTFEGSRLDDYYNDKPGQWGGLIFASGSVDNKIEYAEIKNATIGLLVGTLNEGARPTLWLSNSKVQNMSYAGIFAVNSGILMTNCLVTNCKYYTFANVWGGNYEVYNSTLANYWSATVRTEPSVVLSNYIFLDKVYAGDLTNAYFGNCIIYGSHEDEISFNFHLEGGDSTFFFENSIIRVDEKKTDITNESLFSNVLNTSELKFISIAEHNYHLDTLSVAKDIGNVNIINNFPLPEILRFDIDGNSRLLDIAPDLGVYERVE